MTKMAAKFTFGINQLNPLFQNQMIERMIFDCFYKKS